MPTIKLVIFINIDARERKTDSSFTTRELGAYIKDIFMGNIDTECYISLVIIFI